MTTYKIWHNPRCSKSRQTLDLLHENGIEPEVVLYLDKPRSEKEIVAVLSALDMEPRDLMRTKETIYKEKGLADVGRSNQELISAMVEWPLLIERPIVIAGKKAVLGRPPENVLNLIE